MRALTDADRVRQLMEALAKASETTSRVYFTGGVSAVLLGWRSTIVAPGLIERGKLLRLFSTIEPEFYRYPALDPPSFRAAVEEFVASRNE